MLVTAFDSSGVALSPAKTCTVVPPATSCVISGLTNGITYKFAAKAINATSPTGTANSSLVSAIPVSTLVTFDAASNGGSNVNTVANIQYLSSASNVSLITTYAPHGFSVGDSIIIESTLGNAATNTYRGNYIVSAVPSTTTFQYIREYASQGQSGGGAVGQTTATKGTIGLYAKPTSIILPNASKADSVFSGWYTTQSSGGQLVGAAGATYTPASAITLYASFAGVVYTISYNGNGNTGGTVPTNGSYQAGSSSGYNNTQSYDYTGADQTFTVPNDITGTKEILVEIWGAGGGGTVAYYGPDYGGGAGGYTKATISTATAGETLTIKVGKGGTVKTTTSEYGGAGVGGNTSGLEGSSGGGYSGVFANTTPLAISGGGGGASPGHNEQGIAGGGGGANQSGTASTSTSMGGRAGTTSAGGVKAASCATDGAQYTGGNGCGAGSEGGGGGGAGYYGGGGGNSNGTANGGGGGGSGYLDATRGSLITATAGQNGARANTWAYPSKTSAN
jgi:hypothetical protein